MLRSEGVGVAREGLVPGRSVQHLHPTRNEEKKNHRIDGSAESNEHKKKKELTRKRQVAGNGMAHSIQMWDTSGDTYCQGWGESGTKGGLKISRPSTSLLLLLLPSRFSRV